MIPVLAPKKARLFSEVSDLDSEDPSHSTKSLTHQQQGTWGGKTDMI